MPHGGDALTELVHERVGRAAHELARFPDRAAAVARSLIENVTAVPEQCLERAVAELRSFAAHAWACVQLRPGPGRRGGPRPASCRLRRMAGPALIG